MSATFSDNWIARSLFSLFQVFDARTVVKSFGVNIPLTLSTFISMLFPYLNPACEVSPAPIIFMKLFLGNDLTRVFSISNSILEKWVISSINIKFGKFLLIFPCSSLKALFISSDINSGLILILPFSSHL